MKQYHYHFYILLLALLLLASGGLVVFAWMSAWRWMVLLGCVLLCVIVLAMLWRAASFLPDQVKYFLGCLHSKDTMSRFPTTHDAELQEMYENMNRVMQTYSLYRMELETKRVYYDRILRMMTHELRNSIAPIVSLSEDMLQRSYSAGESREAVEVIHEQCTSIKSLLDNYYELTHLPKPELREVSVKSMLEYVKRLFPEQELSIHCAQGLKLTCDEQQIKQILINLVKNAVEASATSVVITASAPEDSPRITVSDNGPGVPADKQEEIFLPFYTSKSTGSGIGLAISRQMMNMHKGTLTCSSNESGGAVFILQF